MVANLCLNKTLWIVTGLLAFAAALGGVIDRDIYIGLFPKEFVPGAFPQDILTMLVSVVLIGLAVITRQGDIRKQIVIIGLIGSLFYLYGIFTIERVYNWLYLLYAAVFATSFWSMISSLSGFRSRALCHLRISGGMLKTTAFTSIAIAAIFTVLWTLALLPLMREHNRIEYLYSIYILDLCFVMPAFVITAVMALRGRPLGILMGPAMMIVGYFVIFPLGLNELAKPAAGMPISYGPMGVSFAFAAFMLTIAALQLSMMRFEGMLMQAAQLGHLAARAEGRLARDSLADIGEGLAGAAVMALAFITPFQRTARNHWGLSAEEAAKPRPGDECIPEPLWSWTHGIEIDAQAERVWPWVAQIGADRAGFYSYQWLENLAGCKVQNAESLHAEWVHRIGDNLVLHPKMPPIPVIGIEPNRSLVAFAPVDEAARIEGRPWAAASWAFVLETLGDERCRLVSRFRTVCSADLMSRVAQGPTLLEPIGFAMDRRMLLGIRERVLRARTEQRA